MKFQGRTVVITGASSGLGRAAALEFAREGARLGLIARSEDGLLVLASQIIANGGQALVFPVDVTDPEEMSRAAATIARDYGGIDVWINNAAVALFGEVDQVPLHEMRRVMDVNFFGQVIGARTAMPYLDRSPHGGVLMGVLSVLSEAAVPLQAVYTASKHALHGFYKSLYEELVHRRSRVRIATIHPASMATPLFDHARTYLGFRPRPVWPIYPPEHYARILVERAAYPRVLPSRLARFGGTVGYRAQRSRIPKAFSDGDNLFSPMPRSSTVRGSSTPTRGLLAAERGLKLLAAGAFALLVSRRWTQRRRGRDKRARPAA